MKTQLPAFIVALLVALPTVAETARDLTELSLQQLGEIEVTTVSKKAEKLSDASSAIYVITQDDIARSGVTSIPEALRLAPGVQVSQIDSNKWAVGIRGFASRLSRSLLVLMDGRSVYTPLFAGVYWEVQDYLLEDIERIEVIRGPGGTLWGANAVNGVINIITKNAAQTQGGLLKVAGGSEERALVAGRYGGTIGERTSYRVYGKWFTRDAGFHAGTPEFDDWNKSQAGVRVDNVRSNGDRITVQGSVYEGEIGQRVVVGTYEAPFSETRIGDADLSGGNVLARFSCNRGRTESSLQSYFDRARREELNFEEARNTFDFDWQQRISGLNDNHDLVWGAGYRTSTIATGSDVPTVLFVPARKTEDVLSAFVLNELSWGTAFQLSAGSKFEHNDYTGFEVQPSIRFAWTPEARYRPTLWTSVSRAVRTPTRVDTDLSLTVNIQPGSPVFARVLGTEDFKSESVIAYEAGYRFSPRPWLLADAAVFYNDYDRLVSLEPGKAFDEGDPPRTIFPFFEENRLEGHSYGFELASRFDVTRWWRVAANYSLLRLQLTPEEDSGDTTQEAAEDAAPRHQVLLRSSWDLPAELELDAILRYVDDLPAQQVDSFTELDLVLSWELAERLVLSLMGKNLLDSHHAEFGGPVGRVEVERGLVGKAVWTW